MMRHTPRSDFEKLAADPRLSPESTPSRSRLVSFTVSVLVILVAAGLVLQHYGLGTRVRLWLAEYLIYVMPAIGIPCLIIIKLRVFPERVNRFAYYGLLLCFVLLLLRFGLLAFGD